MARPQTLVQPWFYTCTERAPVSPLWLGVGTAAGLAILLGAGLLAIDRVWPTAPFRLFIFATIPGYTLWVGYVSVRASRRDLETLRASSPSNGFDAFLRDYTRYPLRGLIGASILAPLMPLGTIWLQGRAAYASNLDNAWQVASITLLGLIVWPTLYGAAVSSGRWWRYGRRLVRVNVLDLDALAPFARVGLRTSLGILGATPLVVVPVALVAPDRIGWIASITFLVPSAAVGLVALLAPAMGVHRAIQEAKAAELERIRAAIEGDAAALHESPIARHAGSLTIVDLLAYRDRIAALREWPFDAAALRRFGLYLLIPIASWVGAALVERLVDLVVGSG